MLKKGTNDKLNYLNVAAIDLRFVYTGVSLHYVG